jgi:predicted membrane protein
MQILQVPKGDFKQIMGVFNRKIGLFIFFVLVLFFDSEYFAFNISSSQIWINTFMLLGFCIFFVRATPRIKELMLYAVILGFIGEYFFSRGLNMYTYRLENVPFYVPIGHAALYGRVFMFSKASVVKKHHKAIEQLFAMVIVIFATVYLIFLKDVFGFIMTIGVFLLLLKRPKDRLFFYTMYILVAILEIGGTAFGCWKWPNIGFEVFEFLPSNNPPSGISLFYFLLDIGCFFIYTQRHKIAWFRLKNSKKFKANPS